MFKQIVEHPKSEYKKAFKIHIILWDGTDEAYKEIKESLSFTEQHSLERTKDNELILHYPYDGTRGIAINTVFIIPLTYKGIVYLQDKDEELIVEGVKIIIP